MKRRAIIMGMEVNISVVSPFAKGKDIEEVFAYLRLIDERFSLYKDNSEISKINLGFIDPMHYSPEMKKIFMLSAETKKETDGFFSIERNFKIDPSGIVKGYAISESANLLRQKGYEHFSVEIAGDIETSGLSVENRKWKIGIQNPFNTEQIIKVINVSNCGVATSGNYRRGKHIYNPKTGEMADKIASITVIAKNAYDADRFATAAFAMGEAGLEFIEKKEGVEGYMVTNDRQGHYTSGFEKFTYDNN